jgi:DNA-binding winged helix-turn-helix (wHTH) protein/tetratricopeptide (TPR) repeat protein
MGEEQAASNGRELRFHDLVFDADLLSAARDDGTTLRLTRQERALIAEFIARPNRLLSRAHLLAALSGDPGEISDRNVDFIINRLRRKLRDPARHPRFIATQYGEGYTWIAQPQPVEARARLLVIGPVRGASQALAQSAAQGLLALMQTALETRTAQGRVVVRPDWRSGEAGFRFSLEVSFHLDAGVLQAALTLRQEPGREALRVTQLADVAGIGEGEAGSMASATIAEIWRRLMARMSGLPTPTDAPLPVQMQEAVTLLNPADEAWAGIEPKLAADRAADPADPRAAIIWATHLYGLLLRRRAGDPADPAIYERLEGEIERLVFASLESIQSEPVLLIAAASLLLSVDRGHEGLAEGLVRAALAEAPVYAMALPVLGQIAAARGDLEGAVALIDEALGLCEPETEFEIFLLVLKLRTLIAGDHRDAAQAALERIARIKPLAGRQIALLCLRPGDESLTPELRLAISRMSPADARGLLGYQYYIAARRFSLGQHRRNVMAGPLEHLVRRFGDAVMPEAVRGAMAAASDDPAGRV